MTLFYGSYCQLIWKFCSKQSNHLRNKFQERALIIVYNNYDSSFSKLLGMSNESTIHIKNIKVLMTEIDKFLNDLWPQIMNKIFQKQEDYYSLRKPSFLVSKRKFIATYEIYTISFRGPQIWQDHPQDIINFNSLKPFHI